MLARKTSRIKFTKFKRDDFLNLHASLWLQVFSYLSSNELLVVSLVCHAWKNSVEDARYDLQVNEQIVFFKGSSLWEYLSAIEKNENILPYLKERLYYDQEVTFKSLNITDLCKNLQDNFFNIVAHDFWQHNLLADCFKQRAQAILKLRKVYNDRPETLEAFLKLPAYSHEKQQILLEHYDKLEESFSVFSILLHSKTEHDVFLELTEHHHRFMTGKSLLFLEDFHRPNFQPAFHQLHLIGMIIKAAKVHPPYPDFPREQANYFLARFSAEDWMAVLDVYGKSKLILDTNYFSGEFKELLEQNNPLAVKNITENVLLHFVSAFEYHGVSKNYLLTLPLALNRLSDDNFCKLFVECSYEFKRWVTPENPLFLKRLTFSVVLNLIAKGMRPDLFLENTHFLKAFTKDQVLAILEKNKILCATFKSIFISAPFSNFLNEMASVEGPAAVSQFVLQMAQKNFYAAEYILQSPNMLEKLQPKDRKQIEKGVIYGFSTGASFSNKEALKALGKIAIFLIFILILSLGLIFATAGLGAVIGLPLAIPLMSSIGFVIGLGALICWGVISPNSNTINKPFMPENSSTVCYRQFQRDSLDVKPNGPDNSVNSTDSFVPTRKRQCFGLFAVDEARLTDQKEYDSSLLQYQRQSV